MKKQTRLDWHRCLLIFFFFLGLPIISHAQSIVTSGDNDPCLGEVTTYIPNVTNTNYIYTWSVIPAAAADILSANSSAAAIQWNNPVSATVNLTVTDPSDNSTVSVSNQPVSVHSLPAPFITADVMLACQVFEGTRDDPDYVPKFDETTCALVCSNSTVTYTVNGSPGSTYTWEINGASSSVPSGNTCTVNWGNPGNGQVKAIEVSQAGCNTSVMFCIEITEGPVAQFKPMPDMGDITTCLHGEIVLIDESTGQSNAPITNWLWDWGDGTTTNTSASAIGSPVTHQYDVAGDYTVRLTVTNACGCSTTTERQAHVMSSEAPKIACPRVVCEGEKAAYTIDQPCGPGSWTVEGGTITVLTAGHVEVIWDQVDPNKGFGYVMFQSCGPCPVVITEQVPVILENAIIAGPPTVCLDETYIYRLPKWPATLYTWNVSGPATIQQTDQSNEIALKVTGPGTISLNVKYSNTVLSCAGGGTASIEVKPKATITGDSILCQGASGNYTTSAIGNWTLENATNVVVATGTGAAFNYNFAAPGMYSLGVTGTTFCPPSEFLIHVVATPPAPNQITGPDHACAGIPTLYEAGNPISGTSFIWSVPSGGTINAVSGDHSTLTFNTVIPSAAIFVQRVTTGAVQCVSAPVYKVVSDPVPPLFIFGADPVCHSTKEVYILNYADGDQYSWTIADPNLGSVIENGNTNSPTILWNVPPGTGATATMTVKVTKCGVDHILTKTVFIRGTPTITGITWASNSVCSGVPVTMNVTTSYAVDALTSGYTVQWGDLPGTYNPGFPAATSPETYPFTHTFNTDGVTSPLVFNAVITIKDPNGCLGTISAAAPNISVLPKPLALVSPNGPINHCGTGWSETLTAIETTGIAGSNTFAWSGPVSGNSVTLNTTSFGTYFVTVTNSVNGCSDNSNLVNILESCGNGNCGTPPAVVLTEDATAGTCAEMVVNATVDPGVTGNTWIIPDGVIINSSTATTLHATAGSAGRFTLIYRVNYGVDCTNETAIEVTVPYIPELRSEIACNQTEGNYKITLYDHSTQYPSTPITSRVYYNSANVLIPALPGGLQAEIAQTPGTTETYHETISGPAGDECTAYVTVTVPLFPVVDISLSAGILAQGCIDKYVFNFDAAATPAFGLGYLWDYNGVLNHNQTGASTFPNLNNQTTTLTVTDEYGCTASDNQIVNVAENLFDDQSVTANPNPVCQGNPVTLTFDAGSSLALPISFTWFDQNAAIGTGASPNYTVYQSGGYWAQVVDINGCIGSTANAITSVDVKELPAISVSGNSQQCAHVTFTLLAPDYGSGYTYSWSNGTTGTSIQETLQTAGTYTYTVSITDIATGCQRESAPFEVTVSNPPLAPSLSYGIVNCNPYELTLTASGAAGTYNWSNGMAGEVINTGTGGPYQVILTDLNGCRVSRSFVTPKDPADYLWIFPTGCFCSSRTDRALIGPIIPFSSWDWSDDGISSQSGSGTVLTYNISIGNTYNLTLDNGTCSVTSGDMYYQTDTCAGSTFSDQLPQSEKIWSPEAKDDFILAPNPAAEKVELTYRFDHNDDGNTVELMDMIGKRMQLFEINGRSGSMSIDLSRYASGMYQVVVRRKGVVIKTLKLSHTR